MKIGWPVPRSVKYGMTRSSFDKTNIKESIDTILARVKLMAKIKEIEVSRRMTIKTGKYESDQQQVMLVDELENGDDYETVKKDLIDKVNKTLLEIVE